MHFTLPNPYLVTGLPFLRHHAGD